MPRRTSNPPPSEPRLLQLLRPQKDAEPAVVCEPTLPEGGLLRGSNGAAARADARGHDTVTRVERIAIVPEPPPPKDVSNLIDEGFSALRAGDRDTARRCWSEALDLDPSNRMIELNLRRLGAISG